MEEFENEINASFEKFGDGENMDTVLVWENLEKMMEEKQKLQVEVAGIVNAGVICYVEGIRGFLPASPTFFTIQTPCSNKDISSVQIISF